MSSSPPRYLVYWLNSIPSTRCALINTSADLLDGRALVEVAEFVIGSGVPFSSEAETSEGRIRAVLSLLACDRKDRSVEQGLTLPKEFLQADAADQLVKGNSLHLRLLLEHLYALWLVRRPDPSTYSFQPFSKKGASSSSASANGRRSQVPTIASPLPTDPHHEIAPKLGPSSDSPSRNAVKERIRLQRRSARLNSEIKSSVQNSADERQLLAKVKTAPTNLVDPDTNAARLILAQRAHDVELVRKYLPLKTNSKSTTASVFRADPYGSASVVANVAGNAVAVASTSATVINPIDTAGPSRSLLHSYHPSRGEPQQPKRVNFDLKSSASSNTKRSASATSRGSTMVDRDRDTIRTQFTFQQAVPPGSTASTNVSSAAYSTSFRRHLDCQLGPESIKSADTSANLNSELVQFDADGPQRRIYFPDYNECLLIADWLAFLGVQGKVVLPVPVPKKSVHALQTSTSANLSGAVDIGRVKASAAAHTVHSRETFSKCADEWQNGVMFSEVAANLLRQNRTIIKTVDVFDTHGHRSARPRLMLAGTEPLPKSAASSLRNFSISVEALKREIPVLLNDPLLGDIEGTDVIRRGGGILWAILHRLFVVLARVTEGSDTNANADTNIASANMSSPPRGRSRVRSEKTAASLSEAGAPAFTSVKRQPMPHSVTALIRPSVNTSANAKPSRAIGSGFGIEHLGLLWAVATGRSRSVPALTRSKIETDNSPTQSSLNLNSTVTNNATANSTPMSSNARSLASFHEFHLQHYTPHVDDRIRARSLSPQRANSAFNPRSPFFVSATPIVGERLNGGSRRTEVVKAEGLTHRMNARVHGANLRRQKLKDVNLSTNAEASGEEKSSQEPEAKPKKVRLYEDAIPRHAHTGAHVSAKRDGLNWSPPKGDEILLQACQSVEIPAPTAQQVVAVNNWLTSLGLGLMEGEGGVSFDSKASKGSGGTRREAFPADPSPTRGSRSHNGRTGNANTNSDTDSRPYKSSLLAHAAPLLSVLSDRLRNGMLMCSLLYLLEPQASLHANLYPTLHKSPNTTAQCRENLDKALWLLRLKHSPPIRLHFLVQSERVVSGDRDFIFSLLWEIMQAYPGVGAPRGYSTIATNGGSVGQSAHAYNVQVEQLRGGVGPYTRLPSTRITARNRTDGTKANAKVSTDSEAPPSTKYILLFPQEQRRQLDATIMHWLHSLDLLRQPLGQLALPSTILALESIVRDGTLLCALIEEVFKIAVRPYHRQPHTWQQCLSNVQKAIASLRTLTGVGFPSRFLAVGLDEEIVRGNFDVVLGLLEDCYRFSERENVKTSTDRQIYPRSVVSDLINGANNSDPGYAALDVPTSVSTVSIDVGRGMNKVDLADFTRADSENVSSSGDDEVVETPSLPVRLPSQMTGSSIYEEMGTAVLDLAGSSRYASESAANDSVASSFLLNDSLDDK